MATVFEDLSAAEQDARERVRAKQAYKALKKGHKPPHAIERALASDFVAASFDVGELAGKGGFSSAYRAVERSSGRSVVLKITSTYESAHATMCARESAVLAALSHPNIVGLYAQESGRGFHVAVLEALEGPGVEALVDAVGGLPEDFVVAVARDAAAALRHLHAHGVLHRDVKPDNVICAGAPEDASALPARCVLIDFGLARTLSPADVDAVSDASLTGLNLDLSAVGNQLYSAPEVRFGARQKVYAEALAPCTSRYGVAADAYSLGRVLKLALTGQLEAQAPLVALCSQLCAPRRRRVVSDLRRAASPDAYDAVSGLLRRDPRERTKLKDFCAHPWVASTSYAPPADPRIELLPCSIDLSRRRRSGAAKETAVGKMPSLAEELTTGPSRSLPEIRLRPAGTLDGPLEF